MSEKFIVLGEVVLGSINFVHGIYKFFPNLRIQAGAGAGLIAQNAYLSFDECYTAVKYLVPAPCREFVRQIEI